MKGRDWKDLENQRRESANDNDQQGTKRGRARRFYMELGDLGQSEQNAELFKLGTEILEVIFLVPQKLLKIMYL